MLTFEKIDIEQVKKLRPYLERTPYCACEYTSALLYMWGDELKSEVAFVGDCAILRVSHDTGCEYLLPVGVPLDEAIPILKKDVATGECNPTLICIPESLLETIKKHYPNAQPDFRRKWSDYVYDIEDIKALAGRRYGGQRNHVNRFKRENPDYTIERITAENLPLVAEFLERFIENETRDKAESFTVENEAARKGINAFIDIGLLGIIVKAGGRIVSFAIGETVGETLYVHIEKADITVHGSYQTVVQAFAQEFGTDGVKYLNREDDSNDEGLRKSKLSYHPIKLHDKYFCSICDKGSV